MMDGVIPLFSGARSSVNNTRKSWTNQDLAELYRIESALIQAGVSIETERGDSEEGDPWFVFCRGDSGDVLIHVAIIDGEYIIASSSINVIIRGTSFSDIVRQFLQREPAFMLGASRQNNIMIHPSSVLISVFAAICIMAEDRQLIDSGNRPGHAVDDNDPLHGREGPAIVNIADGRHLSIGEYVFTPQQAFIVLSAVAFAASHSAMTLALVDSSLVDFKILETPLAPGEQPVAAADLDSAPVALDEFAPKTDGSANEDIHEGKHPVTEKQASDTNTELHGKAETAALTEGAWNPEHSGENQDPANAVQEDMDISAFVIPAHIDDGNKETAAPAHDVADSFQIISARLTETSDPVEYINLIYENVVVASSDDDGSIDHASMPNAAESVSYLDGDYSFDKIYDYYTSIHDDVTFTGYGDTVIVYSADDSFKDYTEADVFIYEFEDGSTAAFVGLPSDFTSVFA